MTVFFLQFLPLPKSSILRDTLFSVHLLPLHQHNLIGKSTLVVNENGEIREDMSAMRKTLKVAAPMKLPIDITDDARRERHTP
ncbi:hypothetical protein BVRB_3g066200 [Beta vulgaris subsp. vulgaris]|nr:hypothetical protein BVRB_3g066200 [Beta vulgaris subsp. vulgaris]